MSELERRTFAEGLQHLMATLHPRERGPYSLAEVGEATGLSRQYIHNLAKGQRGSPKYEHVRALAEFFGVPAEYFFDPVLAAKVDREIEAVIEHRENPQDAGGRQLAQRVMDLSPHDRQAVTDLIESMRDYNSQPREQRPRRKPEPE